VDIIVLGALRCTSNCDIYVLIMKSILDLSMGILDDKCLWMVDFRFMAKNGSSIHALENLEVQ
jgi:hypothetical protein